MYNNFSVNPWIKRITNAEDVHKAWANKFNCNRLEDYYEGFQWKGRIDTQINAYRPYTLNLFQSTIQIKLASFLFQRPEFIVTPEPGHSHWDLDFAYQSAQLKQDVLNTITKNKNLHFARHLKLAALDSFFRFGLIEVGYAADWRNPAQDDPYLNSWDNPDIPEEKVKVKERNEVLLNERFYIKRIKPSRFVVSVSDAEDLEDHQWVGYWQYYYTDTLRKMPGIKFPKNYEGSSYSIDDIGTFHKDVSSRLFLADGSRNSVSKVWHIWDMVAHKRRLILDNCIDEEYELWSEPMERLSLIDLRWVYRLNGFYPVPPSWHWLSSQDEINESREQVRSYRRRFTRKFQFTKGTVDQEEIEKFVSGPDGIAVEVKEKDAITAIDNPEIGPTSEGALIQAKEDFQVMSGTSADVRAPSDRETATHAKLLDARAQIRESAEQIDFSDFVSLIGREVLCQAQEKLVEGMWVKYSMNPSEGPLQDMVVNRPFFKYIQAQDISDGYDFEVNVDVKNATPAAMAAEKASFVEFTTYLQTNPMIIMSPLLIREAAYRFGYKNEAVIHQLQQVAVLAMAMKAAQGGAAPQQIQAAANGQDTVNAQMATPSNNQISTQLDEQLPVQ